MSKRPASHCGTYTRQQLENIIVSARKMPGTVDGVPGSTWWPAFLLLMLDVDATAKQLFTIPRRAYDAARGEVSVGSYRFRLHPVAKAALNELPVSGDRLFPCNWRNTTKIFNRYFKHLIARAFDDVGTIRPTEKFRRSAAQFTRGALNEIDANTSIDIRCVRKRDAQHSAEALHNPHSLIRFALDAYIPQRLAQGRPDSQKHYSTAISHFSSFLGCDATLDHLNDDTVQQYLTWLRESGTRKESTIQNISEKIFAIWRHAHRSGLAVQPSRRKTVKEEPSLYRIQMDGPRNLLTFANTAYIPQRLADCSKDMPRQYRKTIERFSTFLACDALLDHLEDDIVERFLAWFKVTESPANHTINNARCVLIALWRHAWRKRKLAELPRDVVKFPTAKLLPEAWSVEQVQRIIAAARTAGSRRRQRGTGCPVPPRLFWPAFILVAYDTGLRANALRSIERTHLDWETRWLKAPAEVQKQNADQVFRLHPETIDALKEMNSEDCKLLFPWRENPNGGSKEFYQAYRRILKAAGLPASKRDLFHKLRRTSATAVCAIGGRFAAQQHLGHADSKTTERYLDPRLMTGNATTVAEQIPRPRTPSNP